MRAALLYVLYASPSTTGLCASLRQQTQSPVTFLDARFYAGRRIKVSRFRPQRTCRLGLAGVEFENRQPTNRVRQIERRSFCMATIET
jgi:hypothetical protein